jgi:hypothetical protein
MIPPRSAITICRIALADHLEQPVSEVTTATDLAVIVNFTIERPYRDLQFTVGLLGPYGETVFDSSPQDNDVQVPTQPGEYRAVVRIPAGILVPTSYAIKVGFWQLHGAVQDYTGDLRFNVTETSSYANSRPGGRPGLLALPCKWAINLAEQK